MRAVRQPEHADHVEAHHAGAPRRAPLPEKLRRTDDLALLAPVDRRQRAAEIGAPALPHFDDRQHPAVQADEIEFAAAAAQVARDHLKAMPLQMLGRELFRCRASTTGIHEHACESARVQPAASARIFDGFMAK